MTRRSIRPRSNRKRGNREEAGRHNGKMRTSAGFLDMWQDRLGGRFRGMTRRRPDGTHIKIWMHGNQRITYVIPPPAPDEEAEDYRGLSGIVFTPHSDLTTQSYSWGKPFYDAEGEQINWPLGTNERYASTIGTTRYRVAIQAEIWHQWKWYRYVFDPEEIFISQIGQWQTRSRLQTLSWQDFGFYGDIFWRGNQVSLYPVTADVDPLNERVSGDGIKTFAMTLQGGTLTEDPGSPGLKGLIGAKLFFVSIYNVAFGFPTSQKKQVLKAFWRPFAVNTNGTSIYNRNMAVDPDDPADLGWRHVGTHEIYVPTETEYNPTANSFPIAGLFSAANANDAGNEIIYTMRISRYNTTFVDDDRIWVESLPFDVNGFGTATILAEKPYEAIDEGCRYYEMQILDESTWETVTKYFLNGRARFDHPEYAYYDGNEAKVAYTRVEQIVDIRNSLEITRYLRTHTLVWPFTNQDTERDKEVVIYQKDDPGGTFFQGNEVGTWDEDHYRWGFIEDFDTWQGLVAYNEVRGAVRAVGTPGGGCDANNCACYSYRFVQDFRIDTLYDHFEKIDEWTYQRGEAFGVFGTSHCENTYPDTTSVERLPDQPPPGGYPEDPGITAGPILDEDTVRSWVKVDYISIYRMYLEAIRTTYTHFASSTDDAYLNRWNSYDRITYNWDECVGTCWYYGPDRINWTGASESNTMDTVYWFGGDLETATGIGADDGTNIRYDLLGVI